MTAFSTRAETPLELVEELPRVGRLDLQLAAFDVEAVAWPVVEQLIGDATAGVQKGVPRQPATATTS